MSRASLEDPRYFLNRHLSWLQFNRRVLEEASESINLLLERVKFLAITANNLGEFVEVRVAGLLQQAEQSQGEIGPDGWQGAEVCAFGTGNYNPSTARFYTDLTGCGKLNVFVILSEAKNLFWA